MPRKIVDFFFCHFIFSPKIGDYDPFEDQKETGFTSSLPSMKILATFFVRVLSQYQSLVSAGKLEEAASLRRQNLPHLVQVCVCVCVCVCVFACACVFVCGIISFS